MNADVVETGTIFSKPHRNTHEKKYADRLLHLTSLSSTLMIVSREFYYFPAIVRAEEKMLKNDAFL
jgi:hypothetical protein